jgi:hypothetical protein
MVDADGLGAPVADDRHLKRQLPAPEETPQAGGRGVAQHRARTTGQHSGHGTIDRMKAAVADGIDTRVNAVQTARAEPVADGLFAQA